MMYCPNCNHNLTPLTVETASHGRIEIDHCYFCGGVWFDHNEINRLPIHQTINLRRLAGKSDLEKIQGSNSCPRDKTELLQLKAESIPMDVIVMQCPKCLGDFVSKADLYQLKKAQAAKITYFKTWNIPLPKITSVLVPVILLLVTVAGIAVTATNIYQVRENRIKALELIGTPVVSVIDRHTVMVGFSSSQPVKSSLILKTEGEKEPQTISVSEGTKTTHMITLKNLKAKTAYSFNISVEDARGQVVVSPLYWFMTD